jgi:hypothetical protein
MPLGSRLAEDVSRESIRNSAKAIFARKTLC